MKRILIFSILTLIGMANLTSATIMQSSSFQVLNLPSDAPQIARQIFDKHTSVFGVDIFATSSTSNEKIFHAANMMAEYLDNDEDGNVDNPLVIEAMTRRNAALIMFETENEFEDLFEKIEDTPGAEEVFQSWQTLFDEESLPNGASFGEFDATLEEVLHLISQFGYANAYPDAFGENPGTLLTDAMDVARGGRFFNVPNRYPANAWYTYDDRTCEYNCMAAEYFYWALTSLLDGQNFPGRFEEINHEWRLNTPEKLRTGDLLIYDLLTDPTYNLPTVLPDGVYR